MKVSIANPCIDKIFKIAMTRPNVARGFLNTILNLEGDEQITEVTFPDKDLPSSDPTVPSSYQFTVDVRCFTKDGKHFLIEMQNDFRSDYQLKALIEHSRMIGRLDVQRGASENSQKEFWKEIDGIYTIVLTNKSFPSNSFKERFDKEPLMEPGLVNVYELRHTESLNRRYGDTPNQLIILMLANLCEKKLDALSKIERWSYLMYDENLRSGIAKVKKTKDIDDVETLVAGDSSLMEFIQAVNVKNIEQDMWETLKSRIDYDNDSLEDLKEKFKEAGKAEGKAEGIKEGKAEGKAEGIKEGKAEGKLEGKLETAKKMKDGGLSVEDIVNFTGLSRDDITNL